MKVVIQMINKIKAKALNHRQFRMLLDEVDSMYSDLLLHKKLRRLSRWEVLKCFVMSLKEVKTFLDSKKINYSQLEQAEWLEKLYFVVDMTSGPNTLNTALQGRGRTGLHILEDILTLKLKFTIFARDL